MMGKRQSIPEQVAEHLMQYAQDGWQSLFQNGAAMQDAVLAETVRMRRSMVSREFAQKKNFYRRFPFQNMGIMSPMYKIIC